MQVSMEILYEILVRWSNSRIVESYSHLSQEYQAITGEWFEPHGSWDLPLGKLANIVCAAGAPPITALVFLKGQNEPGGDFWGCAPNVPYRPRDKIIRLTKWISMTNECFAYTWPSKLPV